ncbi:MAG: hypothetical protein EBY17_24265 [Acidobacteriia bacterium]|nr:hypothetical protein [Terriglobia bacterium]
MTNLAPIHPGQILRADLRDEGISISALGAITADTAARLARFFGTSAQYWLNLQNHYDLECLDEAAIVRDVIPRVAA